MSRLLVCAAAVAISSGAFAQTVEPTYKGDPDVYKIIYEDAGLRIIEAVRKAGVTDKAHSHPTASVIYFLTDCKTLTTTPDGKSSEGDAKAGAVRPLPLVASHIAKNTGTNDCRQLFIERK